MVKKYKQSEIRGNTVLAPQYQPNTLEKRDILKEEKKKQKERENGVKQKLKVLRNILLVFIVGFTIIGRYSTIYTMQKGLINTKSKITTLTRENENLKVELVKFNNIQYIEEVATKNLHMVRPDRKSAAIVDLSKENFVMPQKSVTQKKENTIMQKIKNILF